MGKTINKLCGVILIFMLVSCGETQHEQSVGVKHSAIATPGGGKIVSLSVVDQNKQIYTNVLGKKSIVSQQDTLVDPKDYKTNIQWAVSSNANGGNWPSNSDMIAAGFDSCENEVCTSSSNPTGWHEQNAGQLSIHVKGEITDPSGNRHTLNVNPIYIDNDDLGATRLSTVKFQLPGGATSITSGNSGVAPTSGISYSVDKDGIVTFICPTGFGVVTGAKTLQSGQDFYSKSKTGVNFELRELSLVYNYKSKETEILTDSIHHMLMSSNINNVDNITEVDCINLDIIDDQIQQ